jgi:predicted AAA+ superfamily ATPase
MSKELLRWQAESIKRTLQNWRVAAVSGARQSGKTTLVGQAAAKNSTFRTLDNTASLAAALGDPREFVRNPAGTMIIDEVQKAPNLMNEIKIAVDKDGRAGQYLLTGSANIRTLPAISDSLAGRIAHIRLRPLTQGEILGEKPAFLERAFAREFPLQIKGYDKSKIFDIAFRGGYPEAVKKNDARLRREWHLEYVNTLITRDMRDLENIRRQDALLDMVRILAGWSGKYMDQAKVGGQLDISKPTFETYLNALELMFVYEKVMPWTKTDYGYVGRKPKFYSTDTGLMASVLNWNKDEALLDPDKAGKLFETFVFQELAAQVDVNKYDYSLYQYRDHKKHEIDFIVEKADKSLIGIEAKASHSISKSDFTTHLWFRDNIIKRERPYTGYVMYAGEDALRFGDDMIAIPAASLWAE